MSSFILILLGFLVGGFIISMGGGGAAFYLGILTAVAHVSPSSAAATSLFTSIPALAIGAYSHYRTGNMKAHYGNKMIIAAIPAIIVGTWLSKIISENIYNILLGITFVILGGQVIYQSFSKKTQSNASYSPFKAYLFGALSGLMVGIAGMSGGGATTAGLLLMGLTMSEAAATSSYVLIVLSIVGMIAHTSQGNVAWIPGLLIMVGALVGSAIMPHVLNRFDPIKLTKVLRPIMGIIMLIMAASYLV